MKTRTLTRSKNVWPTEAEAFADIQKATGIAADQFTAEHDFQKWKWKTDAVNMIRVVVEDDPNQFAVPKADCSEKEAREQAMEYLGTFEGNLLEVADGANWIYEKVRQ